MVPCPTLVLCALSYLDTFSYLGVWYLTFGTLSNLLVIAFGVTISSSFGSCALPLTIWVWIVVCVCRRVQCKYIKICTFKLDLAAFSKFLNHLLFTSLPLGFRKVVSFSFDVLNWLDWLLLWPVLGDEKSPCSKGTVTRLERTVNYDKAQKYSKKYQNYNCHFFW